VSGAASDNEDWATIREFDATISTADTEAMTATEPIGETALAVSSTAGFAANDNLYIQDASVVTDGEWGRCESLTGTTVINLVDGLTNAKDSSDVIWNDADVFTCQLDLSSVGRVRIVFQSEGTTSVNCHIKAMAIYGDSIG